MYKNIEILAKNAGEMMLEAFGRIESIHEKTSNSDIVTEYDIKIQDYLTKELSKLYPDADFLGEEGDSTRDPDEILRGRAFIIDPIDGTTNFVRNLRTSAVSIALAENGEVIYGCCYIPYTDELFTAEKGKGAFLNGNQIKCSDTPIEHSLASVGTTPYNKEVYSEPTFGIIRILFEKSMDIRRFGSAVIDILNVACGRSDIFCELRLSPWDHAAAGIIASEAGAIVSDMNGNKLRFNGRYSVIAATPRCYDFFMKDADIQKYSKWF